MSDGIDWMKPIEGRPVDLPIWGDAAKPARRRVPSLIGIREEQLRRAVILQKAAKGADVTKGNARAVVERLARIVPGMRYKRGLLIYASLAPAAAAIFAPRGDALPGNLAGRKPVWDAERLLDLRDYVQAWMAREGAATATNALLAYHDRMVAHGDYPPSPKTLGKKLSVARGLSRAE